MNTMTLTPGQLSLSQLYYVWRHPVQLRLDASAIDGINASVACVNDIVAEGRTAYGINTGFGLLAQTRIADEDLQNLQRSLVLSHAAGVGDPLDDAMVRLIMVLKINSLARGFSGIRLSVIEALIALVNAGVYPLIPAKGSVGASGDLAPLAHLSLTLLGEGKAHWQGEWLPAQTALKRPDWSLSRWRLKRGWRCLTAPRRQRPSRCAVCLRHRSYLPPPLSAAR